MYSYQPFLEAFEALSRIKETKKYLLMDLKMLTRKINLFVIDMIHEGFYLFIFDFCCARMGTQDSGTRTLGLLILHESPCWILSMMKVFRARF